MDRSRLIWNFNLLDSILGRIYTWLMAMHSPSKMRKWGSQRSPGIAFGSPVTCDEPRAYVYEILRVYAWHIVFADAPSRRGTCTALVLHLSPLVSSSVFAFTLLDLRVCSFTSRRYCVTTGIYGSFADSYRCSRPRIWAQTLLFFAIC